MSRRGEMFATDDLHLHFAPDALHGGNELPHCYSNGIEANLGLRVERTGHGRLYRVRPFELKGRRLFCVNTPLTKHLVSDRFDKRIVSAERVKAPRASLLPIGLNNSPFNPLEHELSISPFLRMAVCWPRVK